MCGEMVTNKEIQKYELVYQCMAYVNTICTSRAQTSLGVKQGKLAITS